MNDRMEQRWTQPGTATDSALFHGHVTDDELDELLIGADPSYPDRDPDRYSNGDSDRNSDRNSDMARRGAVLGHLAVCASCRERQETMGSALRTFGAATLAWSEARSHTSNRDLSGLLLARAAQGRLFGVSLEIAAPVLASLLMAVALVLHFDLQASPSGSEGAAHAPAQASTVAMASSTSAPAGDAGLDARGDLDRRAGQDVRMRQGAVGSDRLVARNGAGVAETQVASDDAMLRAIDTAIYAPEPSPADVYRPRTATGRAPGTASDRIED